MSYDFGVIPVDTVGNLEEAKRIYSAMCEGPEGDPPAQVIDLINELERRDEIGDDGFLSVWPVDADARGAVLCTRRWNDLTYTILDLTKHRGLAVLDVQIPRLYDPRGRVDVHVSLGGGTKLPYLTARILGDAIARPHWSDPYIVVRRAEQLFVQAFYPPDTECVLATADRTGTTALPPPIGPSFST